MKRRDFIKTGSLLTIPVFINGLGIKLFAGNPFSSPEEYNDKVLVLIQLDGGNDTLNTVIPLDQYSNLSKYRQNILIPENKVLNVNDLSGFHPAMSSMKNLMDDGMMNVVRAVGYPNPNRSHFRSTDIWMSGSASDVYETTGWMGRYFALEHPDYPNNYPNEDIDYPFAISIGSTASQTCQGVSSNYSIAVSNPEESGELFEGEWDSLPSNCFGSELSFVRDTVRQSNAYSSIVSEAYSKGNNLSTKYSDDNSLANNLKTIARLISGGLKTKVYVVREGGFDTHSAQVDSVDTTIGRHAELLQILSDAIGAFQDDINLLGLQKRVMGMTFSEFGRRIMSNASYGTDHGDAVDVFVFGSCVNSGFTGQNPTISNNVSKKEAVAMQYDFRSVYGSLLMDWFGATEQQIKEILYSGFQKIPLVGDCATTSNDEIITQTDDLILNPNPVMHDLNISFYSDGGQTQISIFNELGSKVSDVASRVFIQGRQSLNTPVSGLRPGVYFVRIQNAKGLNTKRFVKI
ncbi:MAG TPA: DUF1501 domain-containing protein [Bacteroidetes bacterium]|nr:DUF1501 domain-containing protein [Bacteroidota bacterium]